MSSEPNSQTVWSPKGRGLRAVRTQTGHPGTRSSLQIGTLLFPESFHPSRLSFHSFLINSCYVSPRSALCFSFVGLHTHGDFLKHEFSLGSQLLAGEAGRGEAGRGVCGGRGPLAPWAHAGVRVRGQGLGSGVSGYSDECFL